MEMKKLAPLIFSVIATISVGTYSNAVAQVLCQNDGAACRKAKAEKLALCLSQASNDVRICQNNCEGDDQGEVNDCRRQCSAEEQNERAVCFEEDKKVICP